MTTEWIDFGTLKEQAHFSAVLEHYGIKHQRSRGQVSVCCPFHDDNNPSLSIHMEQKVYQCFSCPAKGDILHFVAEMEKVSIPEAARTLAGICGISMNGQPSPRITPRATNRPAAKEESANTEDENKPLAFTLDLDPSHPYLSERGLTSEVIETFGVGYSNSGIMEGRIAIPLHDAAGQLVAYSGRWAQDPVPEGVLKYRLPKGFKKHLLLYNYHRVAGVKHLVLVEGYWSAFRLHALEVPALALMGRTLSEEQEQLLIQSGVQSITLLLDEDTPGREATENILPRLSRHFFVRTPGLPEGESPDTVDERILLDAVSLR